MGFFLILGGAKQKSRVRRLKAALVRRGADVCVGPPEVPEALFAVVGRTLVDHCDLVAAIGADEAADTLIVSEVLRYASSRGKLYAIQVETEVQSADRTHSAASDAWPADNAQLALLCEALETKANSLVATRPKSEDALYRASEEYSAYLNMHRGGGVEAIARFLRAFPGGMFEDVVRSELDAATRPDYTPRRSSFVGENDDRDTRGWRMEGRALERLFQVLRVQWPWLGIAAIAAAIAIFMNSGVDLPPSSGADSAPRSASALQIPPPARQPPLDASAAPGVTAPVQTASAAPTPANVGSVATPAEIETVLASSNMSALENVDPVASGVVDGVETAPAPLPQAPRTTRVAHNAAQLNAEQQAIVQRARQAEARGNELASAQSGLPHRISGGAGVGDYGGQWEGGDANGLGAAVWTNGSAYAGSWQTSRPHGYGVLVLANGQQYEGEFVAGAPSGRGVFWDADGRPLTGDGLFAALLQARVR